MVTFQLPAGPKNLTTLFPSVDFSKVAEYYLQVKSQDDESVILTTNTYKRACCCNEDTMRVFFVNYLGGIDSINLKRVLEEQETTSTQWKKSPDYPLKKWDGGSQRFNVRGNETVTAESICFGEDDQEWLKELKESPNAWVQWTGKQSQDDDYIPIVIRDGKSVTRKVEGRYEYVLQIQFDYSNNNSSLRN